MCYVVGTRTVGSLKYYFREGTVSFTNELPSILSTTCTSTKENTMALLMMEAVPMKVLAQHSPRRILRRAMGTTTILPVLRWVITRNGPDREATATALRQRENTSELPTMVRTRLCAQLQVNRLLCLHQPQ